jgi:uncharacterized membrane protein SpoIIM required for sporulation
MWLPSPKDKTHALGMLLCPCAHYLRLIVGTIAAVFVNDAEQSRCNIKEYLAFLIGQGTKQPDFFASVVEAFKYHLGAVFLGFSVLGVVCIPLLSAVRGFFLSFSVSAIIRLLGGKAILLTLAMFGISTVITVPCFFILSVTSFSASQYLFRLAVSKGSKNPGMLPPGSSVAACVVCLGLLLVAALIDAYLTPQLIGYAAAHITL